MNGILRCKNADEAARVIEALDEHIRLTRAEPGCISFNLTATEDPMVWQVSEEFTNPAAFDAHQTRASASPWATLTAGIERDYKITGMP